jgi:tRNA-dihydrouridine synthase A
MMDCTDRHFRYLMRLITRRTLLYTEMISTSAIVHGDRDMLLGFDPSEHPLALQIGGNDPEEVRASIEIAEAYGYDEYNLNVGCPSDRVQHRSIGACLMAEPERVAELVRAMRSATSKPVTVKHRIGIDGRESYEEMLDFVDIVAETGPARFTVHARIAVLNGLNPKENRNIPPLRYEDVVRLKQERPNLSVEVNGGIRTLEHARSLLSEVDAVMLGRAAYDTPFIFSEADRLIFADDRSPLSRRQVVEAMIPYVEQWCRAGQPTHRMTRHMLTLFAGMPGSRVWKRTLSGKLPADGGRLLREALTLIPEGSLEAAA